VWLILIGQASTGVSHIQTAVHPYHPLLNVVAFTGGEGRGEGVKERETIHS